VTRFEEERSGSDVAPTDSRPTVGLIATPENTDSLVRTVVEATHHGYEVIVTYPDRETPEGVTLARRLGATVVDPGDECTDAEALWHLLVGAARARSASGVILVPEPCPVVDYDSSDALLATTDAFSVDAVRRTESGAEPHPLVAIPAYNEAATAGQVVRETRPFADEVLVVDDGSDDGTAAAARDAGATVVEHDTNRGYGSALKTAFREADDRNATSLAILDADGQHDPEDIPALVERLDSGDAEVVIGSRFTSDSDTDFPLYRRVGLAVINVLTNLSMGVVRPRSWVHDTQSGFRLYGAEAVESISADDSIVDHMGASTDILHHAHEHNYPIAEVGTTVSYTVDNASNANPVAHGLTLLSNILKTIERERPITIIGIPGFTLTLAGFLLGYWVVLDYAATGALASGVALLAALSTLIGSLACFSAIILHSLTVRLSELDDRTR